MKDSNRKNALFTKIREYLANSVSQNRSGIYLCGCKVNNSLLYKQNKLWVDKDLHLDVIQKIHDQSAVRHAGTRKTILLIQQYYFWPKMKKDVEQYIRNCHICKRSKAPQNCYNGTLKPLPVPKQLWTDITLNFVTGLPEYELKNAILMVIDRLAKEQVYISCSDKDDETNAEAMARMLIHNIWRRHGLLSNVVSD